MSVLQGKQNLIIPYDLVVVIYNLYAKSAALVFLLCIKLSADWAIVNEESDK